MTFVVSLDRAWNFRRIFAVDASTNLPRTVDLPHIPFVADLDGRDHWFGECEYERVIAVPAEAPTGRHVLRVGAAMHTAVVLVDGIECGRHSGGYLPFEIDLTDPLGDRRPHVLTLRIDNRDNPDVPPGKPYSELDFCWYGGLYRDVELVCRPALHITDPVGAGVVAGGGVFVRTVDATADAARISVQAHIRNTSDASQSFRLEIEILDRDHAVTAAKRSSLIAEPNSSAHFTNELEIARPHLWQPDSPSLYRASVTLRDRSGKVIDRAVVRFGIRRIGFSRSHGFTLNGRRWRPRGTNRHQEYPYVGYAVPAAAQRRDARRIKEAGFDYVRLSHYPQSPEFLDACDELGVLVMNCLPGWQYLGGECFREACYQNAREMIRRDRHHPCVVLWELSLNETVMDEAFMARLHAIGHEEFPGDQMFTCGWQDRYDVFIRSRQHGEIHEWRNGDKALVIAEYGDWEFYASNDGFDQKTGAGVYAKWSNARQRRADGERGLRQQTQNHLTALNDTLRSPAVFDGQWSMFDYARGYDAQRAACGLMDVFRLPKFSYHFYRSQRDANETGANWTGGPVVFIASHWIAASDLHVPVFTNCDEVEFTLNGVPVTQSYPAIDPSTAALPHVPRVFVIPRFVPGTLVATGFIKGRAVASHRVSTPAAPSGVELELDMVGISAKPTDADVVIAHARILDATGTLCVSESSNVSFSVEGDAELVGTTDVAAEAGIASVVLRLPAGRRAFALRATCAAGGHVLHAAYDGEDVRASRAIAATGTDGQA